MTVAVRLLGWVLPFTLLGCGGGGSGAGTGPASYSFVTPALNAQREFARTIVDDAGNTIHLTELHSVTLVNSDGSYAEAVTDPTHTVITANGTSYSIIGQTLQYDSTGHVLASAQIGVPTAVCTYAPRGAGPFFPLQVGESWVADYSMSCEAAVPVSFSQTGTVVDLESVTVPAGTFMALRLTSTLAWTDGNGTTHTQTISTWRDIASGFGVKESVAESYSGNPVLVGHPVQITLELQRQS